MRIVQVLVLEMAGSRSSQTFQNSRNCLKIAGARPETWSKCRRTEGPATLCATVENLVAYLSWRIGFCTHGYRQYTVLSARIWTGTLGFFCDLKSFILLCCLVIFESRMDDQDCINCMYVPYQLHICPISIQLLREEVCKKIKGTTERSLTL